MTYIDALLRKPLSQTSLSWLLQTVEENCSHLRGLALLGGLLGSLLIGAATQASPTQSLESPATSPLKGEALAMLTDDGIYFYGEATEPDQIGATYMVFETQAARVTGAIFMVQSSFDCFQGQIGATEMALQITNSYDREVHGYAIAIAPADGTVAAADSLQLPQRLEGFHNLGEARTSELAMLSTCSAQLRAQ